ncbi:MAG: DMT family transporter [Nanoarchaeota archaeon]
MDKLKQMHFALFLAIVTSLCFIFPAILVKLVMSEISTTGALAIRFFIAAISFPLVLYFYAGKKSVQKVIQAGPKELKEYLLLGFVLAASLTTLFASFNYINANKAMLIFMIYPLFDSVLAWIFLKEKITQADCGAIIATLVGAGFIFGIDILKFEHISGDLLVIVGTFLFAAYLVLSRSIGKHHEYNKRTAWLFIFAFFFLMIGFYWTENPTILFQLSAITWLWLILLGTACTIVPYMCLSYATAYIKSSVMSIILILGNILSIGLVSIIFNEPMTKNMYIGAGFILAAFMISTISEWQDENKKYHHAHH